MAYLRITRRAGREYYYVCTSVRKGGKVVTRVLEYLGPADRVRQVRLAEAKRYWKVTTRKRKARKGGRGAR